MIDRKKVIRGIESCLRLSEATACPECPYGDGTPCKLLHDALVLLKEQEPRVLTPREFDEVRLSKPVWLEVRNMGLLEPALSRYLRPEYGMIAFSLIENRAIERDVTEYNWGWRCWSAEPGDELRKSTMWAMTDEMREAVRRDDEIASGIGQTFSPDGGDEG